MKAAIRAVFIAVLIASAATTAWADPPRFTWHDKWYVPFQASQIDPRFSYMMYVPTDYDENGDKDYPLVVLVHGTERGPHHYLKENAEFAEENDVILLAPLFPIGTHGGKDLENYKFLEYKGTRYDLILLSMVDEIRSKYRIDSDRFYLFGFSGGGHFSHRFFYLHPHRLQALSVGAPGVVTFIDDDSDWWVGTKNVYWRFNARLNPEAMQEVPVHMVIGAEDVEVWYEDGPGVIEKDDPFYMGEDVAGATYNAAGKNRMERMTNLKKNFEAQGITVDMEVVPDAGHDETDMFPAMQAFFLEEINKHREEKSSAD
ncbi:MAG: PHB depolymerase family esterase [Pseudomonadota bacterium]